ncbi:MULTISPECIES: DUF2663 family protein [unclassified Serratia (in: enterobacteria)]|uniref:DUF2663 family protein n=1 Tax=unclassified Serratia (in: enterobacteria) TaxID=2647522 RepID=UPI003B4373E5|nr:DUF2663 family protein [Serratia nematodiphila]
MNKYTIQRNILLTQILASTLILGLIVYFIYPFIEKNTSLLGTYYAATTAISFAIGIFVEYIMYKIFNKRKSKAEEEAIKSNPTEEHENYKQQLENANRNKKIENYRKNYDTTL